MEKSLNMTRRSFLQGLGLVGAVAGSAGVGAAVGAGAVETAYAAEAKAPTASEMAMAIEPVGVPSAWDIETDVVVVGTGGAGGSATCSALDQGARVVTLEKTAIWGGHIQFSGVWGAPYRGIPEQEVPDQQSYPHKLAKKNPRMVSILAHRIDDDVNWVASLDDIEWEETMLAYGCYMPKPKDPAAHMPYQGARFAHAFQSYAEKNGADIHYSTPVRALVQDDSGAIVGVLAQSSDGDLYVKAKSVILACGGYSANPDMLAKYLQPNCSFEMLDFHSYIGLPGATGDGARMAEGVGARLLNMNEIDIYDGGVDDPEHVNGPRSHYSGANQLNRQASLTVNLLGKRFMDESFSGGDDFNYQVAIKTMQPHATSFTIMDSTCITAEGVINSFHPHSCENPKPWFDEDVQKAIESGLIMQADTPEELAEKMGVDPDTFKATLDEYNAACAAGIDEVFYKDPMYLHALTQPPYYATKGVGCRALDTNGGVAFDENLNAVDADGYPIEGLYVAGATCTYMCGIARVIQSGRYAGETAAANALA